MLSPVFRRRWAACNFFAAVVRRFSLVLVRGFPDFDGRTVRAVATQDLGRPTAAELPHGLGLDLADALTGDVELCAHLLERVVSLVAQPEAEHYDLGRLRWHQPQQTIDGLLQRLVHSHFVGTWVRILDQIS